MFERYTIRQWSPNLFVTVDRSMYDNFTEVREYSMMVAVFQQSK